MMRRAVVVMLLVVGAPLQAWAECAWVLWKQPWQMGKPMGWEPTEAADSRSASMVNMSRVFERAEKSGMKIVGDMIIATGTTTDFEYRCLPDTLDPRGPKGK